MKLRSGRIRCERCKRQMPIGAAVVRVHRRLWHLDCAVEYLHERNRSKITV